MKPAPNLRMNAASSQRQTDRESSGETLKATMRHSITLTEMAVVRTQLRVVTALLAGALMFNLFDPALLLLGTDESLVYRAASATFLGPQALARVLLGLAVLLMPFMALQCGIGSRLKRGITQLACLSLTLSAVVWLFLAWRCLPLDLGGAPVIFTRYGAGSLLFALALAWSLNAEQLRVLLERSP